MILKIGPIEIRTGKDAGKQTKAPEMDMSKILDVISQRIQLPTQANQPEPQYIPKPKSFFFKEMVNRRHPWIGRIRWPDVGEDPYAQTSLSLLIAEMDERFTKYQSFDICSIRDWVNQNHVMLTPEAEKAMELFQQIHCKKFTLVHPAIFEEIPEMVSTVMDCYRKPSEYGRSRTFDTKY